MPSAWLLRTKRILEPMAGRGAIVRELRAFFPNAHITACELDAERAASLKSAGADEVIVGDFFQEIEQGLGSFDLAFTNPAYSLAMRTINACSKIAERTDLLLRLNFLGSQERAKFWRENPADLGILPKRPSFAASLKCGAKPKSARCDFRQTLMVEDPRPIACPGCGARVDVTLTDSCEYSWFSWGAGSGGHWRILDIE